MKQLLSPPRLEREDIIEMEGLLCGQLEAFFSFSGHALYFPTEHAPAEPQLLTRERRLLLPLRREGEVLGVLMLHGVRAREARALLPVLPGRGRPLSGQPGLGAGRPHGLPHRPWPRKSAVFTHGRSGRARARPSGGSRP